MWQSIKAFLLEIPSRIYFRYDDMKLYVDQEEPTLLQKKRKEDKWSKSEEAIRRKYQQVKEIWLRGFGDSDVYTRRVYSPKSRWRKASI